MELTEDMNRDFRLPEEGGVQSESGETALRMSGIQLIPAKGQSLGERASPRVRTLS